MEITLRVKIPDAIMIGDMEPPTEQEWQNLITSHFDRNLSNIEANASKQAQQPPAQIAEKAPDTDDSYQKALDTLSYAVPARRSLKNPGIIVEINRD